jgi:hypothetical protein
MEEDTVEHEITVDQDTEGYRATCACGWYSRQVYQLEKAAAGVGEGHVLEEKMFAN